MALDHTTRELEFIDDRERELYAEAKLGEEAHAFLSTELGQVLRGIARQEEQKAKDELSQVDLFTSDGVKKAQRLQFEAAVAGRTLVWFAELIGNGENAYQQLKEDYEH